jgi:hypothetical protein
MSITTGGLNSSKRTNYVAGMVLGVDDFTQEHDYLAGRASMLAQQLGGAGVTAGLALNVDGDTVSVGAGSALDESGAMVTVDVTQCANLADWVAQNQDAVPWEPGPAIFYVSLAYTEATTDPVAIPPGINSTAPDFTAASRVQDSFILQFTRGKPGEGAASADRAFAGWMAQLRYVDGGDATVDDLLDALSGAVEGETGAGSLTPPPASLRIPADESDVFYAAALHAWVTRFSPRARAAGSDTSSASAISLGAVTGELQAADGGGLALVPGSATVATDGVPVVAGTQLLGELAAAALTDQRPVSRVIAAGRWEIRRRHERGRPRLRFAFGENLHAELVHRRRPEHEWLVVEEEVDVIEIDDEGEVRETVEDEVELVEVEGRPWYEDEEARDFHIRLTLDHGYHERHRYVLSALPLVESHAERYGIEEVLDPPAPDGGTRGGPFIVRLAPLGGESRSLRIGFSVQISDLGPRS